MFTGDALTRGVRARRDLGSNLEFGTKVTRIPLSSELWLIRTGKQSEHSANSEELLATEFVITSRRSQTDSFNCTCISQVVAHVSSR